jgi:glycosyltransferase involved in cell wall biosynthesis
MDQRSGDVNIGLVTLSYNQGKFLEEALASVRQNVRAEVSHVIVDPGSKDNSRQIIAAHRNWFTEVVLEPDNGPAEGLNRGFSCLKTDVFGYLNADDRFVPGTLDFVIRYFECHSDTDVLLGAVRIVDELGRPRCRIRKPDHFDLRRYAFEVCFAWQQATFFRADLFRKVGGFNVANRSCWDGELVVDMALRGCRFGYTNRVLGDFRIYPGSITGSGRYKDLYRRDHDRIREKIVAAGVQPMSPAAAHLRRMIYRLSLRRHIANLIYWRPGLLEIGEET